jgi:hypothetical protein
MATTVSVNKEAIMDLLRIKDEFDAVIESLELMSDERFMSSYRKARQQVKKREFADWNDL